MSTETPIIKSEDFDGAVGIDLGTTYSVSINQA
jgi:molecular chaperone DnaK (HSP70)